VQVAKLVSVTLEEGGMLGAGGGWGGGGGGPWDGTVGVMDEVEIVGVDIKLRGAVVALLKCVGGEVIVMLGASVGCWLSRSEGRIVRVRNS
jgi:hypothetical protein